MPSTSEAQRRAMQAAASGHLSLHIPQSVGQEYVAADHVAKQTGLPPGKRKTHRGGGRNKGKGGPGAHHHNALNKAMADGDHATAKKHALNLANALHGHVKGQQAVTPPALPTHAIVPREGATAPPKMESGGSSFLVRALMSRK